MTGITKIRRNISHSLLLFKQKKKYFKIIKETNKYKKAVVYQVMKI